MAATQISYTKSMEIPPQATAPSRNKQTEQIKLAFVFGLIFAVSYLLFSMSESSTLQELLRWYTGIFLLTFASIKLIDYKKFVMMFSVYDIIAKRFKLYAYAYPFIFLALAGLYFTDMLPIFRNFTALFVALIAGIAMFQDIFLHKNQFSCGILGNIIRLPFTTVSLIEDAALVGLATMALVLL